MESTLDDATNTRTNVDCFYFQLYLQTSSIVTIALQINKIFATKGFTELLLKIPMTELVFSEEHEGVMSFKFFMI